MKQKFTGGVDYVRRHPKKVVAIAVLVLVGVLLLVQLLYPTSRLLPNTQVDGRNMSAWRKEDARWELNRQYRAQPVAIYFGERKEPYQTPQPKEIGLTVRNDDRFESGTYRWWLRLVPTSLFWGHRLTDTGAPTYERDSKKLASYVDAELGDSCNVKPKNASLKVVDQLIEVVPSSPGGTCETRDVIQTLDTVQPVLTEQTKVRIAVNETPAAISDADAKAYGEKIMRRVDNGIPLQVEDETHLIAKKELYNWLTFTEKDGALTAQFALDKAKDYLVQYVESKIKKPAGVTKVTTRDFQETSRQEGETGVRLDFEKTLSELAAYANDTQQTAVALTAPVPPRVEYTRTYSPTDRGFSALVANYAKDHPGTYGISLIELSGQRRRANYNGDTQFVTASTYKLFVAYSTLKRVQDGTFSWGMQIANGRNLDTCFKDMIIRSDNPCAEALVDKIGYRPLTDEARSVGAQRTTFVNLESYRTTANDLAHFVASLESGQLGSLSRDSQARLINAMRENIFRQGVPAGVTGQVANKVGFLDGFLHDAAIVYSPHGTYTLAIMTEDSSWAHIAEITRQIETLRSK